VIHHCNLSGIAVIDLRSKRYILHRDQREAKAEGNQIPLGSLSIEVILPGAIKETIKLKVNSQVVVKYRRS